MYQYPEKQGLYDPQFEHDNCGVGFVVQIKNRQSHQIVEQGLSLLCNLNHRGALGADPDTGDGSGILIQIPHQFFVEECQSSGFHLPESGEYGIASIFLPQDPYARRHCGEVIESHIVEKGMDLLGWVMFRLTEDTLENRLLPQCQLCANCSWGIGGLKIIIRTALKINCM